MDTINERIKFLRNDLKLTAAKFAEPIGISRPSVTQIETGVNAPSDRTIKLICMTYNVNEEWLRNGTGNIYVEMSRSEVISEFLADVQIAGEKDFKFKLINALAKLSPDQWDVLQEIAESLVKEDNEKE